MNSKIIAVDFDGTLCENKWPEIGEANKRVIEYLKKRKADGDNLILWTCRVNSMLSDAVAWCEHHELIFDAVNENLPEIVESFGTDTRKIFANLYIDDRNMNVALCKEKSDIVVWAEKEIEIACKIEVPDKKDGEFDYGCACYNSALKAYNSLTEDGHSGMSIVFTKQILNRLIEGKPLTPIEDVPEVWNSVSESFGCPDKVDIYQCKRMSSLFKDILEDGTTMYKDINRNQKVNNGNPNVSYHSGLTDKILNEMFPITMPYLPESKPYKVICDDFLTNRNNGDYDTVGIYYVIKPDGEKVEINRFFKEGEEDYIEIDVDEYEERRLMYTELLENPEKEQNDEPRQIYSRLKKRYSAF